MQYKIPVQIENEDPILLWLSWRQLTIIMVGFWIWYSIFQSLAATFSPEVAAAPWIIIWLLAVIIAVFKYSEMTFVPFVLSFIRYKVNLDTRKWSKWVDSFSALDIWFINAFDEKSIKKIDTQNKIDKIKDLEENLNKI